MNSNKTRKVVPSDIFIRNLLRGKQQKKFEGQGQKTKPTSRALAVMYTKLIADGGMAKSVYAKLYKSLVQPVFLYWPEIQRARYPTE